MELPRTIDKRIDNLLRILQRYGAVTITRDEIVVKALKKYLNEKEGKHNYRAQRRHWLKRLMREQDFRCYYCLKHLTKSTATLDHKVPHTRGGAWDDSKNLVACCTDCNAQKGNLTDKEFLLVREHYPQYSYIPH